MVSDLITPAILGLEFLQQMGWYWISPVRSSKCILKEAHRCGTSTIITYGGGSPQQEATHWCNSSSKCWLKWNLRGMCHPWFGASKAYKLSENCGDEFRKLIEECTDLFCTTPGKTTSDCNYIPTKGPPIRVPPRRISGHYRDGVNCQLELMLSKELSRRAVVHGWQLQFCT